MLNKTACIDCADSGVSNSSESLHLLVSRINPDSFSTKNLCESTDISLEDMSRVLSSIDNPQCRAGDPDLPPETLDTELLVSIFEQLNSVDRLACARVCRKWREIITNQEMWNEVIPGDDCNYFDILHVGQFIGLHGFSVHKIDLKNASTLIPSSFKFLTPLGHSLRYLRLCRLRNIKIDRLLRFTSACPDLCQLDLSNTKILTSEPGELAGIAPHLRLSYLNLNKCDSLDSPMLKTWSCFAPNLSTLHLKQCCRLTDDGISAMVARCQNISEVVVDFCPLLTERAFVTIGRLGTRLKTLSAKHCLVSDSAVGHLAGQCRNLAHLNLRGCHFVGEFGVLSLAKHCTFLKTVDLSYTAVNDIALQMLINKIGFIEHVRVEKCSNISDQLIEALVNMYSVVIVDKTGQRRKSAYSTCVI